MKQRKQKGNILVSSLLILVVMNLLGAGLMQSSYRESTMAQFKTVDSNVFQVTESCTHDVISYFEGLTGTPASVADISIDNDTFKGLLGSISTKESNKMTDYSYNCSTAYLMSKSVSSGVGTGGEVGGAGGEYGGSGGMVTHDYYQITATGSGPDSSTRTVNAIISVEY